MENGFVEDEDEDDAERSEEKKSKRERREKYEESKELRVELARVPNSKLKVVERSTTREYSAEVSQLLLSEVEAQPSRTVRSKKDQVQELGSVSSFLAVGSSREREFR